MCCDSHPTKAELEAELASYFRRKERQELLIREAQAVAGAMTMRISQVKPTVTDASGMSVEQLVSVVRV